MTEKYLFFDSTTNDRRRHKASDMAEFWGSFLGGGLFVDETGTAGLAATSTGQRNISVGVGDGVIYGHLYINDAPIVFSLDEADTANTRIDRIVLRFDNHIDRRFIKLFVLKGTPSSSPIPVALTRTDEVYELSIATIKVNANTASISPSDIVDERYDSSVCGIATTKYASASAFAKDVYLVDLKKNLNATNVEAAINEITRNLTVVKSSLDEMGVFKVVEWKKGAIVLKRGTFSNPNPDGNYQTDIVQEYSEDGFTLRKTTTYALGYNSDGQLVSQTLVSEVV